MESLVLKKTSQISMQDFRNSFSEILEVERTYAYKVTNTGKHSNFMFYIFQWVKSYLNEESTEKIIYHVKLCVKPGETKKGMFKVSLPYLGIDPYNSNDKSDYIDFRIERDFSDEQFYLHPASLRS